jgi:hypothetical protein
LSYLEVLQNKQPKNKKPLQSLTLYFNSTPFAYYHGAPQIPSMYAVIEKDNTPEKQELTP